MATFLTGNTAVRDACARRAALAWHVWGASVKGRVRPPCPRCAAGRTRAVRFVPLTVRSRDMPRGGHGHEGPPRPFVPRWELPPGFSHARSRSEEHTSELQSLMRTSYAVFCLNKQNPQVIN